MSFIGIISNEENENYIRRRILDNLELDEQSVLFIKEKSIEDIKNIQFQTIVITREFEKQEELKEFLLDTKYLIMNSDIKSNLNLVKDMDLIVITYGFNSKATITASSVEDEGLLLCVQRDIEDINGNIIEEQEINIDKDENCDDNSIMAIGSVLLLYGKI